MVVIPGSDDGFVSALRPKTFTVYMILHGHLLTDRELPAFRDIAQEIGSDVAEVKFHIQDLCDRGIIRIYNRRIEFNTGGALISKRHLKFKRKAEQITAVSDNLRNVSRETIKRVEEIFGSQRTG